MQHALFRVFKKNMQLVHNWMVTIAPNLSRYSRVTSIWSKAKQSEKLLSGFSSLKDTED